MACAAFGCVLSFCLKRIFACVRLRNVYNFCALNIKRRNCFMRSVIIGLYFTVCDVHNRQMRIKCAVLQINSCFNFQFPSLYVILLPVLVKRKVVNGLGDVFGWVKEELMASNGNFQALSITIVSGNKRMCCALCASNSGLIQHDQMSKI